jgi:flagellar assembly protein FliH
MSKPAATLRKPSFLATVHDAPEAPARFASIERPGRAFEPTSAAPATVKPAPEPTPDPVATARALQRIELAVSLLRSQGERLAEQARADALELAFMMARKILERELRSDPVVLMGLIRSAISRAGDANRITVRLNTDDAETLRASGHDLTSSHFSLAKIEVIADPTLTPGDCVIETNLGTVDGRLSIRLEEMREAVDSALQQEGK